MKIAFVINSLSKGGAERVVSLLSQELSKEHDVFIILFDNSVAYEYGGKIIDIDCKPVSGKMAKVLNVFKRRAKLKKIFDKQQFDKIFAFMESAYLPAIFTGYPVIASIRNNIKVYSKLITKYILPKAEKIIVVSKDIEKQLNCLGLKLTQTIQNPIVFDDGYKITEELTKFKPFILAVGRLHDQKNFKLLIESFKKSKSNHEMKLLIIGEGQKRDELQELINTYKLQSNIYLLGQKDNIKDYYLQCEIFVLSSKYEGFPNVLIEALSNNCACISTDCPTGPREIIKNNDNGLLIKSENIDEMIKSIDGLYFDENMKKRFRKNAQKSVSHLSIEKIAKEWLIL